MAILRRLIGAEDIAFGIGQFQDNQGYSWNRINANRIPLESDPAKTIEEYLLGSAVSDIYAKKFTGVLKAVTLAASGPLLMDPSDPGILYEVTFAGPTVQFQGLQDSQVVPAYPAGRQIVVRFKNQGRIFNNTGALIIPYSGGNLASGIPIEVDTDDVYTFVEVQSPGVWVATTQPQKFPVGTVTAYAANSPSNYPTPPPGWLQCAGGTVSRVTYARLFALVGSVYGAGDGSTSFTLPDFRGKIPVGSNLLQSRDKDISLMPVGSVGGEQNHILTIIEIPAHTHSYVMRDGGSNPWWQYANAAPVSDYPVRTTGSTGGSGGHNNMQPYLVMNYIIKY